MALAQIESVALKCNFSRNGSNFMSEQQRPAVEAASQDAASTVVDATAQGSDVSSTAQPSTADQVAADQAAQQEWVRTQYQKAVKYLAEKGVIAHTVSLANSRYLLPYLAVWQLEDERKQGYWVIAGDLPTDHVALSGAKDARDAVRMFSFRWQLQAENLMRAAVPSQTTQDFVNLLVNRAHDLYRLYEQDDLWGGPAS